VYHARLQAYAASTAAWMAPMQAPVLPSSLHRSLSSTGPGAHKLGLRTACWCSQAIHGALASACQLCRGLLCTASAARAGGGRMQATWAAGGRLRAACLGGRRTQVWADAWYVCALAYAGLAPRLVCVCAPCAHRPNLRLVCVLPAALFLDATGAPHKALPPVDDDGVPALLLDADGRDAPEEDEDADLCQVCACMRGLCVCACVQKPMS